MQVKDSIDLPDAMRSYFKQVTLRQNATYANPAASSVMIMPQIMRSLHVPQLIRN